MSIQLVFGSFKSKAQVFVLFLVLGSVFSAKAETRYAVKSGDFTANDTWSPAGPLTSGDVLIINSPYNVTMSSNIGWYPVYSIVINTGGRLTHTGSLTMDPSSASITVNTGGTLSVAGELYLNQASLNQNGGTISVGSLNVGGSGKFNYSSGALSVASNLTVSSGAVFSYGGLLSPTGNVTVSNGTTVNISTTTLTALTISNGSKINLQTSATLAPAFSMSGASELTFSGGTLNLSSTDLTIPSSAKITVTSGTLRVRSLTATGTIVQAPGTTLQVTNGLTINGTGSSIGSGATATMGTLTVSSGSFSNSGALTSSGLISVNGGAFTTAAGSSTSAGSLNVTSSGGSSFTNGGTFTVSGNVTAGGPVTNNGTMDVGGNLNGGGGGSSTITNNAILNISGSVTLPSSTKFYTNPGAVTTVTQNVTTSANQNLIIGTGTNPPPYADFIIKGNLISTGSGDILINRNGRLAVFGSFSADGGGGSVFTINDGGQVYINGTITMNGNGDHITNNNDGNPYYGFYSPNQPVYTGSGSNSNGAAGSNTVQDIVNMPSDFYTWVSNIPGSPLTAMPVKLISFKARLENNQVVLTWATSKEEDFSHFEVEQAAEDLQFKTIGRVDGAGYTTDDTQKYSFTHASPVNGVNYYRLKAVDIDGSYEYFRVESVVVASPKSVYVYANPSNGQFINIASNFNPGENAWVTVYRADGVLISQNNISGHDVRIDFARRLAAGVYLAKYVTDGYSQTMRFVVK